MKVLITTALSAQAHVLKTKLDTDYVVLGDYNDIPSFMLTQGKMIKLPNPQSASYAHLMLTLCLDNAIDVLYVLDVKEAEGLADSKQLFAEYNIDVQTNEV
jgi:hypothetical protein